VDAGAVAEVYARPAHPAPPPGGAVGAGAGAGELWSCGSGLHVGGRLVLTSRHVVCNDADERLEQIRLRFLGDPNAFDGAVVWCGSGDVDAALVEVSDPAWQPRDRRVGWGRLVGSAPGVACTGDGFPDVVMSPDGARDVEQFRGSINPRSGVKAGRWAVTVADPPQRVKDSDSPWAGMSGAGVFASDLLVGVVAQDAAGFASQRLSAVPVTACLEDPVFRALVEQAAGDEIVPAPVELVALFTRPLPANSPAQLLRADVQTVPFHGRQDEIRRLSSWCEDSGRFSSRLVVGKGGQGKTRLGRKLMTVMEKKGWVTGFVRARLPTDPAVNSLSQLAVPALIVVDYAETRVSLLEELSAQTLHGRVPVRFLLLARAAGDWRETAAATSDFLSWLPDAPVMELPPVDPDISSRRSSWAEAITSFSIALETLPNMSHHDWGRHGRAALTSQPQWLDTDDADISALSVQLDALVTLLSAAEPELTERSTLDTLLRHERKYWELAARARSIALDPVTTSRAVAAPTLWSALDEIDALDIIRSILGLRDMPEDRQLSVAHWLSGLYPADSGFWSSLQPDRLGEHHVATALITYPDLLVLPGKTASRTQIEHALTTLARAIPEHRHLERLMSEAIVGEPLRFAPAAASVALQAADPRALLDSLDRLVDSLPADTKEAELILESLQPAIPPSTHLLANLAYNVALRIVSIYRNTLNDPQLPSSQLAGQLQILASRCGAIGRDDEGLGASEEAVSIYRKLVELHGDQCLTQLATSLVTHSSRLARIGHSLEGLVSCEEAVSIYRSLTVANEASYLPQLANALSVYSDRLSWETRHDEGLAASEESVSIYRMLAANHRDAFLPQLAAALTTHSNRLHRVQRHEAALRAIEEALAIHRRLAEEQPDAYLPALARSAQSLVPKLIRFRRRKEALEASKEVANTYSRLASSLPGVYSQRLAHSLATLSANLLSDGSWRHAVRAAAESVETYRNLAADNFALYAPGLADALTRLSRALRMGGRVADAKVAAQEAVELSRRLSQDGSTGNRRRLAISLFAYSELPSGGRNASEALSASEEALRLWRDAVEAGHPAYLPELIASLKQVAHRMSELDRHDEGITLLGEAAQYLRRLARAESAAYSQELIGVLAGLSDSLSRVGRHEEALRTRRESVDMLRTLAQSDTRKLPEVAAALNGLGDKHVALGQHAEAIALSREAIRICGDAAKTFGSGVSEELAAAISASVDRAFAVNLVEDGIAAMHDAVTVRRSLADSGGKKESIALARLLSGFADRLGGLGRSKEACSFGSEAVKVCRGLCQPGRMDSTVGSLFAHCLREFASNLSAEGRQGDAVVALREAADIFGKLAQTSHESYGPPQTNVLRILAKRLREMGRHDDWRATVVEMLNELRILSGSGHGYMGEFAKELALFAGQLSRRGSESEAQTYLDEAIEVRRRLASRTLAGSRDVVRPLTQLAAALGAAGRHQEAVQCLEEVVLTVRGNGQEDPAGGKALVAALTQLAAALGAAGRHQEGIDNIKTAVALLRQFPPSTSSSDKAPLDEALVILEKLVRQRQAPVRASRPRGRRQSARESWR
jgi:hypothetical protein